MTTDAARRRTEGLGWYDLVREDAYPMPEWMQLRSRYVSDTAGIPVERYTSRRWHELERKYLWRKVWQFVCREEHIPEVGSYVVYEIAGDSYIVVRTRDGIKARRCASGCPHHAPPRTTGSTGSSTCPPSARGVFHRRCASSNVHDRATAVPASRP